MSAARRATLFSLLFALLGLSAVSQAETVQKGELRVKFQGKVSPGVLPRSSLVPVTVAFSAKIASRKVAKPPKLTKMSIALNRNGRLDAKGLPVCPLEEIQPANNAIALKHCRRSLVGEGSFSANIQYGSEPPLPSHGKLYAFNGRLNGHPAVLAHVYARKPAPTSYTLPFVVSRSRGTFGTVLRLTMPREISRTGYVTGLSLTLDRSYTYRGRTHDYISASCPAPGETSRVPYLLARGIFHFKGGTTLTQNLPRSCRATD